MGRWITWVVLGLFIVIVPFGSWYYLKKGLDYRKKSLSELVAKMDTQAACRTYNILAGEGRRVAAALLIENTAH